MSRPGVSISESGTGLVRECSYQRTRVYIKINPGIDGAGGEHAGSVRRSALIRTF
jgi:hypothetical protein